MNDLTTNKLIQFQILADVIEQESAPEAIALRGGFGVARQIEAFAKMGNDAYQFFLEDRNAHMGALAIKCIEAIHKITQSNSEKPEKQELLNQQFEYIKSIKNKEIAHESRASIF